MSVPGYLYILTNPSMPGLVKVGRTERHPEDRRQELSLATGVPTPFHLDHWIFVSDCHQAEKDMHTQWAQAGYRVRQEREFFRRTVEEARADLDAYVQTHAVQPQAQAIRAALDQGFQWWRGDARTLRNTARALECFEQAAAMGDKVGAYFAGIAALQQARQVRRKQDRDNWEQRALGHFQTAMQRGHTKACAQASRLYRAAKMYQLADGSWDDFLTRTAASPNNLDEESVRWIWSWAAFCLQYRKGLPAHPIWSAVGPALLRQMPQGTPAAVRKAVHRRVHPHAWLLWVGVVGAVLVGMGLAWWVHA